MSARDWFIYGSAGALILGFASGFIDGMTAFFAGMAVWVVIVMTED